MTDVASPRAPAPATAPGTVHTTREIEALIPHRWPFLLIDRIYHLTDLVITKGVPFLLVGQLLAFMLPSFLAHTLPMALLVAVLLAGVFYVLAEDYIKSGVSLGLALLARPDFVLWVGPAYLFLFVTLHLVAMRSEIAARKVRQMRIAEIVTK